MDIEHVECCCSFCKRLFRFSFYKNDYYNTLYMGFKSFKNNAPYLSENQRGLLRSGICSKCYNLEDIFNNLVQIPIYFRDLTSELKEKILGTFKTTLKDEDWEKTQIFILERHIIENND